MMQHPKAHNNPFNIPKQSKTYPMQSKPEEAEDEPKPIDYKNKVKTITSLNNQNNRNLDLINEYQNTNNQNHNQIMLQENNHQQNNFEEEEEEKPRSIPQLKNYSNTNNSSKNNKVNNKAENTRDSAKFNASNNSKNMLKNNYNNVYDTNNNQNNYSENLKSVKGSSYHEAVKAQSSGSNLNKNFKANTTEYALNNSNNTFNQNLNQYSLRQNKISGHTYTKLAERMKSGDKQIKNANNNSNYNYYNDNPNYVKNKTDSQGKFTSEIFNSLNNQLNQNRNFNEIKTNEYKNEKENTAANFNSFNENKINSTENPNNIFPETENHFSNSNNLNNIDNNLNNNSNINHNHTNSAAYCKKENQSSRDARSEAQTENLNNRNLSPRSNNSKNTNNNNYYNNNYNNQTNIQIEKLDPTFVSQVEIDQNASLNKSQGSRQKNSTRTDIKLNTNKAAENVISDINNFKNDKNNDFTEQELINNFNPNLFVNKLANLKKFEEENYAEPSMQKLDYSVSDDQLEQKQNAFKSNSHQNLLANPDGLLIQNNIFQEKKINNADLSVSASANNQNSNFNSINNTHSNFNNITHNNYQSTNNMKTNHSSKIKFKLNKIY